MINFFLINVHKTQFCLKNIWGIWGRISDIAESRQVRERWILSKIEDSYVVLMRLLLFSNLVFPKLAFDWKSS